MSRRNERTAPECFVQKSELGELFREADARIGVPLDRQISPIRNGLSILDKVTLGYMPKQITAVGGRPGSGKTSFATTVTANIMRETEQQVLYISTEATPIELVLQASEAFAGGVPTAPKNTPLYDHQKNALKEAHSYIMQCMETDRLSILYYKKLSAGFLVDAIRHHCEVLHGNEVALIIVDQMNRVKRDHRAGFGSYALATEDLMNELECIADEEDVPMMLLSQLNRHADSKEKPTLGDFKHSGSLEEYSSRCLLLHRPDIDSSEAEILVRKNRGGMLADIPCSFSGAAHTWKEA